MQKASFLQGSLQSHKTLPVIALLVLVLDQLTKLWIDVSLSLGESWPHDGFLRFTHRNNEGIVFGFSAPYALTVALPIIVLGASAYLAYRYSLLRTGMLAVAVGLFIGGNLGNLIDRIRLGYVTDFIDFNLWGDYHWPAFNIADLAIVIAVILIVVYLLRSVLSPAHRTWK